MSNTTEITLAEKQILHAWIDNPSLVSESDMFLTEIGLEFQFILLELKEQGLDFIPEHILKKSIEYINVESINAVLETQYQSDKIDTYISELHSNARLIDIESNIIHELNKEFSKSGRKDLEKISKLSGLLEEQLSTIHESDAQPYSMYDALVAHQGTIELRSKTMKQHSGCFNFDKLMPHIVPGLCTVGGYSGSMKSTFVTYLARQRIIKRLPTLFVNTELAFSGFMDGLISSMIKEPYYDILGIGDDPDMIDFSNILEKYDGLMYKYFEHDKFRLWPKSSCSLSELKSFIVSSRKKMNIAKETTMFVFIDLMSMLDELNGVEGGRNKADTIEAGVNILNDIGLTTNTLLIGTVQLKRNSPVKRIEREEDIEKFRPTLVDIKSAGAYEERSRFVILLHNPFHIVHKTPCNPILRDTIDPILEATMMKDTYIGMTGDTIKYYFNAPYKALTPYTDPIDN